MDCLCRPAVLVVCIPLLLNSASEHGVRGLSVSTWAPQNSSLVPAEACVLSSVGEMHEALQEIVSSGVYLVNINLRVQPDSESGFQKMSRDLGVFRPLSWRRTSSRQGQSMLMLRDIYDVLSLSLLSIKVETLGVMLDVTPDGCLQQLTSQELLQKVRSLLINDFQAEGQDANAGKDVNICNQELRPFENHTAQFVHVCCRKKEDGEVACHDVTSDPWLEVLFAAVLIIKVLAVLYSPSFLPESVYHHQTSSVLYVYHLPKNENMMLRIVVTGRPRIYGKGNKVVRASKLQGMPSLRRMLAKWTHDRVHEVSIREVYLTIKVRKLLGENHVPINLIRVLYTTLFLCRLRRLSPFTDCCSSPVFGRIRLGPRMLTWYRCMRAAARLLLMAILVLPWILRLVIYYNYEKPSEEEKTQAALQADVSIPFTGSFILYLSPVHVAFIICYVILCFDTVLYSVLSPATVEKMKILILRCLHDMRETSKTPLFTWIVAFICKPFTYLGVLYLPLLPVFLVLLLPVLIPLFAFYMFPAVNLTCRLLFHILFSVCPTRLTGRFRRLLERVSAWMCKLLQINAIQRKPVTDMADSFTPNEQVGMDLITQTFVAMIFLVTFWSLTFLLMELLAFAVEMAVYTFIGLILTCDVTTQYLSIIFFLVLYSHGCVSEINSKYLSYHKLVQNQLLSLVREEVETIAKAVELHQENTALRVQGKMADEPEVPAVTLDVRRGGLVWRTSSMLLFLDRKDTPYTPERFFEQTIDLSYCGCPGQLHVNAIRGLWRFARIVAFLIFVFIVVMAFGSAYRVSSTNQLLATVAGGFIPFAFTYFFESKETDSSMDPESVQFRTQLHTAVNEFQQTWPVFDLVDAPDDPERAGKSFTAEDALPVTSPQPYRPTNATSLASSDRLDEAGRRSADVDLIIDISKGDDYNEPSDSWMDSVGSSSMLNHRDVEQGEDDEEDEKFSRRHQTTTTLVESDGNLV